MNSKCIAIFFKNTKELFLGAITGLLIALIYCFFIYDIVYVGSKETYYTIAAICSSITIIWTISIFTINENDKENNRKSDQFRKFYIDNFFTPNVINEFNYFIKECLLIVSNKFENENFDDSLLKFRKNFSQLKKKSSSIDRISEQFKKEIDEVFEEIEDKIENFYMEYSKNKSQTIIFDQLEVDLYVCQNDFHILVSKKIDFFFKCFDDK